jgi:hypothetical protein
MGAECSLLIKNRLKTDKVEESFSQPSANAHGTPGCRSPGTMRAKTPGVRGRCHEPGARAQRPQVARRQAEGFALPAGNELEPVRQVERVRDEKIAGQAVDDRLIPGQKAGSPSRTA